METIKKILAIDPSGKGTTGVCIITKTEEENETIAKEPTFSWKEFKNDNWLNHLKWIIDLVKEERPNKIIYETTNYISVENRGEQVTSIFKLFGGIESLKLFFDFVESIGNTYVSTVKHMRDNVDCKKKWIRNLSHREGSGGGWLYDLKENVAGLGDGKLKCKMCKIKLSIFNDNCKDEEHIKDMRQVRLSPHMLDAFLVYYIWKEGYSSTPSQQGRSNCWICKLKRKPHPLAKEKGEKICENCYNKKNNL